VLKQANKKLLVLPRYGWLPEIKYVQIQTHSRCNASCLFCPWIESDHHANPGKMTDETWQLILRNLVPFSGTINNGKMIPYLMQEPLIDKTIFQKINDIYRYFPKTCVEVSTNGTALTESVVTKLFECFSGKRHDLWVSHHGIDKQTFEHIMELDYEKSLENLIYLIKASNSKFIIKIRGAGTSFDKKHVYFSREQYLEYWKKLTVDHQLNMDNVSIDAFHFHDRAGTLHRSERGANQLNMGVVRKIDPEHPFHCPRIDEWLHFGWDGAIRLCCMDYHKEVILPNIKDTSLLEYFHGPVYRDLVEKVSGRKKCEDGFICLRCHTPGG